VRRRRAGGGEHFLGFDFELFRLAFVAVEPEICGCEFAIFANDLLPAFEHFLAATYLVVIAEDSDLTAAQTRFAAPVWSQSILRCSSRAPNNALRFVVMTQLQNRLCHSLPVSAEQKMGA
jgi:hypothetical protein